MGENVIEVRSLRKSYGALEAVRGIDLAVREGEVFALLGPNGAGKTTTVEILEGFRPRDAGEVRVLGHDPADGSVALRAQIGIVLQSTGVDAYLTVRETIDWFAANYPSRLPTDEVIELVELTEKRGARVNSLSGGQKRRLDVAIALAGDPRLLFLDEPTTGFDPGARRNAWQVIRNLQTLGKTILLTTHYMDEAQELADRVAVISAGRIVAEGTPDTLGGREQAATRIRFRLPAGAPPLPGELGAATDAPDELTELHTDDPVRTLHRLTGWALDNGVELRGIEVVRPSLEDVYLELTGPGEEVPV
ncbi:MAG: ABC transporter ATP-binding protein [Nitriliruptorales bacterium]